MKRFYFLLLCLLLSWIASLAFVPQQNISKDGPPQNDSLKAGNYVIKIIPVVNGYGYDIYNNNKLFIHQPTVPAMPGNSGFTTRTIAVDELKQLGVIPK